jgi:hypothetical protein
LGTNTKSTTLRIQELAISNQTTKIDTHEENCFHYKLWGFNFCGFRASLKPQKLKSNENYLEMKRGTQNLKKEEVNTSSRKI